MLAKRGLAGAPLRAELHDEAGIEAAIENLITGFDELDFRIWMERQR